MLMRKNVVGVLIDACIVTALVVMIYVWEWVSEFGYFFVVGETLRRDFFYVCWVSFGCLFCSLPTLIFLLIFGKGTSSRMKQRNSVFFWFALCALWGLVAALALTASFCLILVAQLQDTFETNFLIVGFVTIGILASLFLAFGTLKGSFVAYHSTKEEIFSVNSAISSVSQMGSSEDVLPADPTLEAPTTTNNTNDLESPSRFLNSQFYATNTPIYDAQEAKNEAPAGSFDAYGNDTHQTGMWYVPSPAVPAETETQPGQNYALQEQGSMFNLPAPLWRGTSGAADSYNAPTGPTMDYGYPTVYEGHPVVPQGPYDPERPTNKGSGEDNGTTPTI
ncbi:hypothetical protein NDN08_002910 [Rhodosorus marinus]|uniref:MARVEL domain-containing protein n=1 Tax=Rhodosorus marinus TaxID=101924 RepID=A0AAV8UZI0_9RHOD|nr:hypothetical protein NDN08_002910 [Rhodosorus marinus]